MTSTKNIILNHIDIQNRVRRIAYQIFESNVDEDELIIAGIDKGGYVLAKMIKRQLDSISNASNHLCKVVMDKKSPLNPISTSLKAEEYANKSLILVDDVLNSGSTLMYAARHFLDVPLKQFKTAVLVNRNHKRYPVKADFKGISLSTSLNEHVNVNLNTKPYEAYLD